MKKVLLLGLLGVVIGALVTAFLFAKFLPRPDPGEPVVVTVKEPVYINTVSGQATIPERLAGESEVINPNFKVSIPVRGEFATESANVKVSGETIVEKTGELLKVDTLFYNAEINVKYKPPPVPAAKLWSVGVYLATDFDQVQPGGFIQRDFPLFEFWGIEAIAFGRVEVDGEARIVSGIEVFF